MARKIAAAVFSLGCIHTSASMALGLGELSLESFLNEPLKAKVDLLDTEGLNEDQVKIRLATKEDFQRLGVDRAYFLTGISFEVIIDGKGQGTILITSDDPVLEPYLDFIVEARWPAGRLLREYTVLVDPPVFDSSTKVISANETVAAMEGGPSGGQAVGDAASRSSASSSQGQSGSGGGGFASATSGSLDPGSRYMVSRNDTLWEIASAAKPEGATVHQTMLDIQRLNPDAFINGNINQIKAGYLIYLPESADISAADEAAVIEEIRQQNEAWRENREAAVEPTEVGPSLRISAAPDEVDTAGDAALDDTAVEGRVAAATAAIQEDLEKSELERADAEQRLAAVQDQLATLEQIVSVKDDQIAALQAALAEAGVAPAAAAGGTSVDSADGEDPVAEPAAAAASAAVSPQTSGAKQAKPAPAAPAPVVDEPGLLPGWLGYLVGGLVVVGGGAWWLRRRREEDADEEDFTGGDVFADVELQEERLELQDGEDESAGLPRREEPQPVAESNREIADQAKIAGSMVEDGQDSRGYGEHKHDEYASDVDSGDALAEADIYVAYGRYPQAIELLNNAVRSEPENPVFRLKLMSLFAELGDREQAQEQLYQLRGFGSESNIEEGERILGNIGLATVTRIHPATDSAAKGYRPTSDAPSHGLDLDDFESDSAIDLDATVLPDLAVDKPTPLEPDFAGLEIEESSGGLADDLDLSIDFDRDGKRSGDEEEEMVFAAEGSEMSTKLDLARAYMDMGDEEGAKQILEEVASEGSEDQREEARLLLQRVG